MRITLAFFSFLSMYAEVAHKRPYQHKKTTKKSYTSKRTEKTGNHEQQKVNENKESFHFSTKKESLKKQDPGTDHRKHIDKATIKAFRMLGVLSGIEFADVKRTYRLLVLRYNPDRVARGNELMKKFAENKIREINKAYGHLKKWFSDS